MSRKNGISWALVMALAISTLGAMPAMASDKTVSSVTLRINSELESETTLPSIDYSNDGDSGTVSDGDICISNSSTKYSITSAEWTTSTSKTMKVGDTPEMKVTLTPNSADNDDYRFKGTYRSSNVSIRYGTFVSASKKGDDLVVRLKVRAIKGTFPAPEDAYWKDNSKGTARWEEPEEGGTGNYEVVLRRGSNKIHSVETTSRSYNFYPYMTSAGTYTFRVRTIAKTNKQDDSGTKSEWVDSDEIYLAKEDVSDGSGQSGSGSSGITSGGPGGGNTSSPSGNMTVGWQKRDNNWYYYFPDGSYQKNGWLKVADKWYLFQSDGRMLTGWQNVGGQTFYLTGSGDMQIGWIQAGQRWYYLNPTQDTFYGCLVKNHWMDIGGKTYYFTADGAMAEGWNQVDGNWYYFYPGAGNKAVNTNIDTFYVNADGVWVR
ncbi:MAG: N-acetylmuramoyl-L-alanine amidase family protein [Lachnospiraceae bacterium]|nr:N-acetylmuramoyl-L-alanine amidase family protein [Lachnospiraceae bacterium]